MLMSLSSDLKYVRQKLFLTQDDFAAQIKVSVATINRWENGRSRPNMTAMKNLKAFCEQNNLPFEKLESEWLKEV
ncbi:helix-turn-helix transcriptional regulator [Bengtsoniella intestinalis]|uniref:helix-turn-helix domain-containing protein n=1 Tax=Bengtsoniella intestinalis TaxID=3073143 RepID=UPI00391F4A4D